MIKNKILIKCLSFAIIVLFFGTSILPNITSENIKTNELIISSKNKTISQIINESLLDLQFIYNITENLSNIIFTEYNKSAGEIAKGRDFGTKGEHKAADILYENLTNLGIWTRKEKINNSIKTLSEIPKIASKLELIEKGLTIINTKTGKRTNVTEFFTSERWNLTGAFLESSIGILLNLLCCKNGFLDKKYHLYDENLLSYNFSYENLSVVVKPFNYSIFLDFKSRLVNNKPFVYIAKDYYFGLWKDYIAPKFKGLIYNKIFKEMNYNEKVLWYLTQPNCKGLIFFDSDNNTYNMGAASYCPIPIIRVNRSIGYEIFKNSKDYEIDFYINQKWNESVDSYNVIGQINGTNPDKTIILSCLYDSWWCQGTADSAIGMAMVLGVAKYYKEHNITPNCNLRFVGFCGEEQGLRGAYFHEAVCRNENITTVIDLNQLGFTQIEPRLRLDIHTNNKSLNCTLAEITNRSNYVNRTDNVSDFNIYYRVDGGPPSNSRAFTIANNKNLRTCDTVLFVKEGNWIYHHRDGQNHQEGDVIKYFNWTDTSVTSEIVYNVTHYFTNEI